jgi:hypothetical protein
MFEIFCIWVSLTTLALVFNYRASMVSGNFEGHNSER